MATIPKSASTRMMRLVSAGADLGKSMDACRLCLNTEDSDSRYHFLASMVIAYGRPFTESEGIGNLHCEYPNYPDFTDPDLNLRHHRMMDLRNRFFGHSSIHGTQAILFAPGYIIPGNTEAESHYWYIQGKRHFENRAFIEWLGPPLISALLMRVQASLREVCKGLGRAFLADGECCQVDGRYSDFDWNIPK